MTASVQVIYPIGDDTHFDYDYYTSKHMDLVNEHMGPHIQNTLVTKGLAGGPEAPPDFYVVASFTFADQAAMGAALDAVGLVLADLPNFTNSMPHMLIGDVLA